MTTHPPPHLARQVGETTKVELCATCRHSFHGAPCRAWECVCRGPFADVPDAWLPVVADEETA